MIEIIKIIILTCQVNSGGDSLGNGFMYKEIDRYQRDCQQKLLKCVDLKFEMGQANRNKRYLIKCLENRK